MPPAISRKEDHFQSYRSGYHEDAPSLDGLCRKRISLSIIAEEINKIPVQGVDSEILHIPLRCFVDASRDKPERRPLSVLSLRLPRRRAYAR